MFSLYRIRDIVTATQRIINSLKLNDMNKLDLHRTYYYELESKEQEIDKLKAEIKKLKGIIEKNINYIKLT